MIRSAAVWGSVSGLIAILLVVTERPSGAAWLVVVTVLFGGLLGVFFQHRDRAESAEDDALAAAMRAPENHAIAAAWIARLRVGEEVKVRGAWVTLTPQGVRWRGLRRTTALWSDVDRVGPWTMSARGLRAARGVMLEVGGRKMMIACTKRNFAAVLATCVAMSR